MTRFLMAAAVAGVCLAGVAAAQAQTIPRTDTPDPAANASEGKQAGTFMIRLRAIGVVPLNLSSSVSAIGGKVAVTNTPAPELDLSYFFTDNIAAELIAASTRHEVAARSSVLGRVDVGSVYVLPPTLTLQYHFMPRSRFSPYLGVGLSAVFFYDSNPARPTVTKVGFSNTVGPAIQAGFDYNISGPWFANFDVKQIFVHTTARLNGGAISAKTALDPLVIGAGIGYRF